MDSISDLLANVHDFFLTTISQDDFFKQNYRVNFRTNMVTICSCCSRCSLFAGNPTPQSVMVLSGTNKLLIFNITVIQNWLQSSNTSNIVNGELSFLM